MRKQKYVIVLSMLTITAVFMSGCTKNQTNNQQTKATTGLETCAELNGYVCNESQECNGTWLNASDNFRCCSCECSLNATGSDALTTDLFEEASQDEGFGDIQ